MKVGYDSNVHEVKRDLDKSLDEIEENSVDHSDDSVDSSETKYVGDMKNPSRFLTAVGGLMVINMLTVLYVANFIVWNIKDAKLWYRYMRLKTYTWVYFAFALIIKVVASFGYRVLKSAIGIIFVLDCVLSGISVFGIYWFFETRTASAYEYKGHWVIVIACCLFATAFGYFFSTLINIKSSVRYSVIIGTLIMTVFTGVTTTVLSLSYPHNDMVGWYLTIWALFIIFHIYLALTSVFIIKYEGNKLTKKDKLYIFYRFNTDWFSFFWMYIIKEMTSSKKKKKKNKNKNKKSKVEMDQ